MPTTHGVLITTFPEFLECIRSDFTNLQQKLSIPCDVLADFSSRLILRAQDTPTTYYGEQMKYGFPPVIEFPSSYFSESDNLRQIILLHELIHACQDQTTMKRWHERTVAALKNHRHHAIADVALSFGAQKNQVKTYYENLIKVFHSYFQIIFEVWNHLYMRENYSGIFETEMINVYQRLSHGTSNGSFDDWGSDYMFHIHKRLLESIFFAKITAGLSISTQFNELANFWQTKLDSVCESNQYEKFLSIVDTMTRIDAYPNDDNLELQYLILCKLIIDKTIFDDISEKKND